MQDKAVEAAPKRLNLHRKQQGTVEPTLQMQKQPQLPYTMTTPRNYRRKRGSSTPHQRGATAATLQRQRKAGGQQTSPDPTASHAWLASHAPHTASRQRRAATASMTASGHENGERDRVTAIGHSDPLASKLKLLP